MNRDSTTISLWQQTGHPLLAKGSKINLKQYDVVIVGAGITGLSLGLLLQEAGKKCLILEANNIGFGTTSGTTAHLNTVLDTPYPDIISKFGEENAKLIAKAAAEAIDHIRSNTVRYNIACDFADRMDFMVAENEQEEKELNAIFQALEKVGIPCSYADAIPVPISFRKAISFNGQAQFHPLRYLSGLTDAFVAKGGAILEHRKVEMVERDGDVLVVDTGTEKFQCSHAVYATHIPPGINLLNFRCAPYRSYLIGITLEDKTQYPEALLYDMKDPYHYFRTACIDGRDILLVGGGDHKTGHHSNPSHIFTELEAYVRTLFKIKSVDYKWSAQYYEPNDGLPYIGHLPGSEKNVFVATGYSGNGMIFGTLAGRIITDMILEKENPYARLLTPSRIKPVAAFKNFVKENADVVKHFIADRITIKELEQFSDLAKGEGRVVKYQERQVAVYKDEQGIIKALHPVCPHAGCIVQWNNAEKSWDCPCHGARYNRDGELLTGPATSDLKKIDID